MGVASGPGNFSWEVGNYDVVTPCMNRHVIEFRALIQRISKTRTKATFIPESGCSCRLRPRSV